MNTSDHATVAKEVDAHLRALAQGQSRLSVLTGLTVDEIEELGGE